MHINHTRAHWQIFFSVMTAQCLYQNHSDRKLYVLPWQPLHGPIKWAHWWFDQLVLCSHRVPPDEGSFCAPVVLLFKEAAALGTRKAWSQSLGCWTHTRLVCFFFSQINFLHFFLYVTFWHASDWRIERQCVCVKMLCVSPGSAVFLCNRISHFISCFLAN